MSDYRLRDLFRGILLAVGLVALATALIFALVQSFGLTRGSTIYLIPVLIAAIRWGFIPAVVASFLGVVASAFLFFPPLYSFEISDPQEIVNLVEYVFVAVIVSQLAYRLKLQLEMAQRREVDLRDLYSFSRRLAVAFDVADIHAAIEDHLTMVIQRQVVLFVGGRESSRDKQRAKIAVPEAVRAKAAEIAAERQSEPAGFLLRTEGAAWIVRSVASKNPEFGVIAIDLGDAGKDSFGPVRARVDAVLADATATLERLGVAHAIGEARMRAQADRLREALIGSVSHELRTPLASILGAATVLSAAPALRHEKKLHALVLDVRNEAERLNNDIQNLLDATRISSDGVNPHMEWAEPADIIDSAIERCRSRLGDRTIALNISAGLPLIHVDPVLVQQALIQIFDNAAKYSPPGSRVSVAARARDGRLILSVSDQGVGLIASDQPQMWDRFVRGDRHGATTSGSGLGLWIANAFIAVNDGKMTAVSDGPGQGTTVAIELPVTQMTEPQLENDADE